MSCGAKKKVAARNVEGVGGKLVVQTHILTQETRVGKVGCIRRSS